MTSAEYRKLALQLPDTEEREHMNHPDFRVGGTIFATLGYPKAGWAMVKLSPAQQAEMVAKHPGAFVAVKGKWGESGCTNVILKEAAKAAVASALKMAWLNNAPEKTMKAEGGAIREEVIGKAKASPTKRGKK